MPHDRLPPYLADRGFVAREASGIEYIAPPLCTVETGSFHMGSEAGHDPDAKEAEFPLHQLTLRMYSIGRYPVTVAEYRCAVRAGAVGEPPLGTLFPIEWPVQLLRPEHPTVCVSWHDALAYAAWLAALTGQPWRLPTEAEWEQAARGTDRRIYPWGNTWDAARANTSDGGPGHTTPVGSYPQGAGPCGACDLAGNVWEWTSSLFRPYPYPYVADDGRERLDAEGFRVLRGGSWNYPPHGARTARRGNADPLFIRGSFGFRLVLPA